MRQQKQRDYSYHIKNMLANNEKTFEFFALCLTVMIELPETDRNIIAKFAAYHAANHFYDDMKKDKDKKFKRAFRETIYQSLIQGFDDNKAASFVNVYTRTAAFTQSGMRNYPLKNRSILKNFTFRELQLDSEQRKFIGKLKIGNYSFPENHLKTDRIYRFLRSQDEKLSNSTTALHLASVLITIAILSVTLYHLSAFTLNVLSTEPFQPYLALMLIVDALAFLVDLKFVIPVIFNSIGKEAAGQAKQLKSELINAINQELKQSLIEKIQHKSQQSHDESAPFQEPTYHFPLFSLPSINPSSNTLTTERKHPKVKTRPAFVAPTQAPLSPERLTRKDIYLHNGLTFHRIFNRDNQPTQDFIGLDNAKISLTQAVVNKVESLLEHPRLVKKDARSGIVNIKDEKQHNKDKSTHLGLFKIKDKGVDKRCYTNSKTESINLDDEMITLHTASIAKKHTSKKNG